MTEVETRNNIRRIQKQEVMLLRSIHSTWNNDRSTTALAEMSVAERLDRLDTRQTASVGLVRYRQVVHRH